MELKNLDFKPKSCKADGLKVCIYVLNNYPGIFLQSDEQN